MNPVEKQGLWAFYQGKFYAMAFDDSNRSMDHVTWFDEIGLPVMGPGYDRIVRGRLLWNHERKKYVLSWYALPMLPNRIYRAVLKAFATPESAVLEKPILTEWVK